MGTINTTEFEAQQATDASTEENTTTDDQGGDLILGKFKSQTDLEKAYQESQKKITELSGGSAGTQENPTNTEENAEETADSLEIEVPEETEEEASGDLLNLEAIDTEWAETGTLSEETLTNLESKGIPKERMNLYMRGIEALNKQTQAEGFALVGGESEYATMIKWAVGSLSPSEVESFNAAVSVNADSFTRESAILALRGKFVAANGSERDLIQGSRQFSGGTTAFKTEAEKHAAMSDPKYKTDPEYRSEVEARILAGRRA